jgi:hypothetical protein
MYDLTARRPAGHIIIVGDGPKIEADTLQCVHCGKHWVVVRGSGRRRGFCMRCNGVTCGAHDCETRCEPEDVKVYGELYVPRPHAR